YAGLDGVPIGSLKSNLGHLITAAGVAGLIKVLAAMKAGVRPPTVGLDSPIDALTGSPFRVLTGAEPWTASGPRIAGVSAFGFGGNNAHLLVEEPGARAAPHPARPIRPTRPAVAIVGVSAKVADGACTADFARALFGGEGLPARPATEVAVALEGLRFPPKDLEQALAQQLLVLEAAREAAAGLSLPRERTGVVVGMGCDPEVARYGLRWRLPTRAATLSPAPSDGWIASARDAVRERLEAAGVLGTMPNIPANRINQQLDAVAFGFTVSGEELSGHAALEIASRALAASEVDAAVVGAVDLSCEPVHREALRALTGEDQTPGDAAVALVLERLEDARRLNHPVLAVLGGEAPADALRLGDGALSLDGRFGRAHAATALVHVAAAALAVRHRARPAAAGPAMPWLGAPAVEVSTRAIEGDRSTVVVRAGDPAGLLLEPVPRLHVFSGADRREVLENLAAGRESAAGPARLALVAASGEELREKTAQAKDHLERNAPAGRGVAFRDAPLGGELAFVFGGAGAAYSRMGADLVLAMPGLVERLAERVHDLRGAAAWVYEATGPGHPLDQLWGASFLAQIHAVLTREVLGLRPQATLGYSSGESNALFAMGAWNDLDAMIRESREGALFTRELAGAFEAPRRAWRRLGVDGPWAAFTVAAPVEQVRAALEGEPLAHLTIVNAPDECVIGGEASACERVLARIGRERALPLGYGVAAHTPEVEEVVETWRAYHRRPTAPVPGVRFYSA
ncbi:MAG: beta keto-acyl synthase, partial [Gemmatimonadetes bacterium]|nr:beta keto-acyl synthase [Gemmatimonadota bacterium]